MTPAMNNGSDTAQGQDLAGGQEAARDVTRLLHAWSGGDGAAAERLTELVYAQVRAIAGKHLRQFANQVTLQPTELAHELFLRLIGTDTHWQDRRHFYAVVSGKCVVTRETPLNKEGIKLAELGVGDTFGEEALISEAKRNATVTMLTEGVLMRLKKEDFRELMNEPLLQWRTFDEAKRMVDESGARWLDVRLPSEHQNLAIEDSINIPLYFIRLKLSTLDRSTRYVVYCDTGRRSSAAAFILMERGYDAYVLKGGLSTAESGLRRAAPPR